MFWFSGNLFPSADTQFLTQNIVYPEVLLDPVTQIQFIMCMYNIVISYLSLRFRDVGTGLIKLVTNKGKYIKYTDSCSNRTAMSEKRGRNTFYDVPMA